MRRFDWFVLGVAMLCLGASVAVAQDAALVPGFEGDAWAQGAGFPDDGLLSPFTSPLAMSGELALLMGLGGRDAPACHGAYTCPSPKSCGSWSASYDCDDPFCGGDSFCDAKGAPAWLQPTEKFRACTLGNGSSCYEYTVPTTRRLHCGC